MVDLFCNILYIMITTNAVRSEGMTFDVDFNTWWGTFKVFHKDEKETLEAMRPYFEECWKACAEKMKEKTLDLVRNIAMDSSFSDDDVEEILEEVRWF